MQVDNTTIGLSGDLEVYIRKVFSGKWLKIHAQIVGSRMILKEDGEGKYEKDVFITGQTEIEKKTTKDRNYVFELSKFNGSKKTKRLFDCKSAQKLNEWMQAINAVIAQGGSVETAFALKNKEKNESKKVNNRNNYHKSVLKVRDDPNVIILEITQFRISKLARLRFIKAIHSILEQNGALRRRQYGYTGIELASLKAELGELRRECGRVLRFKIRRVLRVLRNQAPKMRGIATAQAQEHGILIGESVHNNDQAKTHFQATGGTEDVASILARLPDLLRRNRVLANLARTLEILANKATNSALSIEDAVSCLLAGKVIEALLNLPGGLSILLSLPAERFAFKKLCVSALLCKVPLFTTRILELLAALAVLPETQHQVEALRMVRSVFTTLDKRTYWGQSACLREPLIAATCVQIDQRPPSFAAISQIILDQNSRFDLRTAAIQALTAICAAVHRAQGGEHALWTQVQIFYALRCIGGSTISKQDKELKKPITDATDRRRASTTNVRRMSATDGTEIEEGSLCAPLVALLEYAENTDEMLRIAVERFLDSWDARELDEAELLASLDDAPGSAIRCAILASRIRRAALLLAHADVDELLHKLGEELEVAAAQPASASETENQVSHIDVHATAAALHRLQPRGSVSFSVSFRPDRPLSKPALTTLSTKLKDDPKYSKYFKMLRLHIPVLAVAQKMQAEGLDSAVLDLDPEQPLSADYASKASEEATTREKRLAPEIALKDHPVYAKYFRMLKMHIPRQAVVNKMNADGLDATILDKDPEGPLEVSAAAEPALCITPLKDDKIYGKYIKQLRMHVPRIAIEAKMAAEGLDSQVLHLDPDKPLPAKFKTPNSSSTLKSAEEKKSAEPPKHCARPPNVKVRKVFLDLITDGSGTFYQHVQTRDVVMHAAAIEELERVFHVPARRSALASEDAAAAAQAAASDMAQIQAESARGKGQLESIVAGTLGPKRAFALNLMFGSLKIPTPRVADMLTKLDKGNDLAQLGILYNMLADASEVTAVDHACNEKAENALIKKYDEISQFFLELRRVPRKRSRVVILWLAATVEDRALEIRTSVEAHSNAAIAVSSSSGLKRILHLALAISNFTNSGTARSNVAGVKLSSLLKLRNTKTTPTDSHHQIKNLLAFVVKHVGIEPDALRTELSSDMLAASYLTTPRNEIKTLINQLGAELDVAKAECESLKGASHQDIALTNATTICNTAEKAITELRADFDEMEKAVDQMLATYGEAPNADFEELLRSIDRFVVYYEDESRELDEADARRKRREQLAQKQQEREKAIGVLQTNKYKREASSRDSSNPSPPTGGALRAALKRIASGRALEFTDETKKKSSSQQYTTLKSFAHEKISQIRGAHRPQDNDDYDDDDDDEFD